MTEPEVCEELDRTILEFMNSLKELSSLRNKYRDVVKEVGTVAKQGCIHKGLMIYAEGEVLGPTAEYISSSAVGVGGVGVGGGYSYSSSCMKHGS